MRLMACCGLGFGVLCSLLGSICYGQTELFRFSPPPSVTVFRSTDPAPGPPPAAYVAPAVPVTAGYPSGTTVYSVPVASPQFVAPVPVGADPAIAATPWEPVTTTNYAPAAPTTVYSPVTPPVVVSDWTPVDDPTAVSVYRPTVTYQPVVVPEATVVAAPTAVPATTSIPVGPRVTVRPKVYIQGQPIRNFFRAVTP